MNSYLIRLYTYEFDPVVSGIHIKKYWIVSGIHIKVHRVVSGIQIKDYRELYQEYILRLQKEIPVLVIDLRDLGVRQCKVLRKILARSVQLFWRFLDTNGQTDKQSIFVYVDIDIDR